MIGNIVAASSTPASASILLYAGSPPSSKLRTVQDGRNTSRGDRAESRVGLEGIAGAWLSAILRTASCITCRSHQCSLLACLLPPYLLASTIFACFYHTCLLPPYLPASSILLPSLLPYPHLHPPPLLHILSDTLLGYINIPSPLDHVVPSVHLELGRPPKTPPPYTSDSNTPSRDRLPSGTEGGRNGSSPRGLTRSRYRNSHLLSSLSP